jgi:hypothetical protein
VNDDVGIVDVCWKRNEGRRGERNVVWRKGTDLEEHSVVRETENPRLGKRK